MTADIKLNFNSSGLPIIIIKAQSEWILSVEYNKISIEYILPQVDIETISFI